MTNGRGADRAGQDDVGRVAVRVFISYAHDDAAHEDRVRDFWRFLREHGVDARADMSAAERRQDWAEWMTQEVRYAERVLVVASPAYKRRAEGHAGPAEGRGVQWEARLIRDLFYADQQDGLQRFLPVVLPGCSADDIPLWMGPAATTHYQVSEYTVAGAETLLRLLTGQPGETEPPLGVIPVLPPRGTGAAGAAGLGAREASPVPRVLAATLKLKRSMSSGIYTVAFSPNGRVLASGGEDKIVRLWNPATGENLGALTGHTDAVRAVAFSPNGQLLASVSNDKTVRLWYLGTGRALRALTGHTGLAGRVSAVAFSPDGQLLASGGGDKTVRLWHVATGQAVRVLTGHTGHLLGVEGLAFSPDGRLLASAGGDKTVRLWHVASGQAVRVLTGHDGMGGVWDVAFSPDGRLLATAGGRDQTVRLWSVATGQSMHTLAGHTGMVRAVAFSPDGRLLASGSHDKTVRLWDPPTGQLVHILTGHKGLSGVEAVTFSPDGSQLATASGSTVQLWH